MSKKRDPVLTVLDSEEAPVSLTRITPPRSIRIVFWGLRVYIALMVALVILGFVRGMH